MIRIQLNDNALSAMQKLAEYNPGALSVLVQLMKNAEKIDPQGFMGGMGCMLDLDTLGIYGSRIWMLYKDVCDCDIVSFIAVLRGHQLGILTRGSIDMAIDGGEKIDIKTILELVRGELNGFTKSDTVEQEGERHV